MGKKHFTEEQIAFALRLGRPIEWNAAGRRATGLPEADRLIDPPPLDDEIPPHGVSRRSVSSRKILDSFQAQFHAAPYHSSVLNGEAGRPS